MNLFSARGSRSLKRTTEIKAQVATELGLDDGATVLVAYQHAGGILASGCDHGKIALWKPGKRTEPDAIAELPAAITGICWSPKDDLFAAIAEDGSIAVYRPPERTA